MAAPALAGICLWIFLPEIPHQKRAKFIAEVGKAVVLLPLERPGRLDVPPSGSRASSTELLTCPDPPGEHFGVLFPFFPDRKGLSSPQFNPTQPGGAECHKNHSG